MAEDGVQPNTKTFTALIGSVGKMNTVDQAMDIIEELLSHDQGSPSLTQTYQALMSACEKAGQWDLAVALFDRMSSQVRWCPETFLALHSLSCCTAEACSSPLAGM